MTIYCQAGLSGVDKRVCLCRPSVVHSPSHATDYRLLILFTCVADSRACNSDMILTERQKPRPQFETDWVSSNPTGTTESVFALLSSFQVADLKLHSQMLLRYTLLTAKVSLFRLVQSA